MSTIKCKLLLPTGKTIITDLDSEYQFLPNFKLRELANNQAKEEIKFEVPLPQSWTFLKMVQITRNRFGETNVNSCFRTESFNASLPNADPNSCHKITCAIDIAKPSMDTKTIYTWTEWWRTLNREFKFIGAIGLYPWGAHLEILSDVRFGQKEFKVRDYR